LRQRAKTQTQRIQKPVGGGGIVRRDEQMDVRHVANRFFGADDLSGFKLLELAAGAGADAVEVGIGQQPRRTADAGKKLVIQIRMFKAACCSAFSRARRPARTTSLELP